MRDWICVGRAKVAVVVAVTEVVVAEAMSPVETPVGAIATAGAVCVVIAAREQFHTVSGYACMTKSDHPTFGVIVTIHCGSLFANIFV